MWLSNFDYFIKSSVYVFACLLSLWTWDIHILFSNIYFLFLHLSFLHAWQIIPTLVMSLDLIYKYFFLSGHLCFLGNSFCSYPNLESLHLFGRVSLFNFFALNVGHDAFFSFLSLFVEYTYIPYHSRFRKEVSIVSFPISYSSQNLVQAHKKST